MCKLSSNLLIDPVVVESGISYEREEILKYIKDKEKLDPITKTKISSNFIPNLAIKESIVNFLDDNPCCFEIEI